MENTKEREMDHHPTDLLPAFSLGILEDTESIAVQQHLKICRDCRMKIAEYDATAGHLALAAPSATPPRRLKQRLLHRIKPEPHAQTGRLEKWIVAWPRLFPASILAALILIVTLAVSNILMWQQMQRPPAMTFTNTRMTWLQGTAEAAGAVGALIMGSDNQMAVLIIDHLAQLPPEYQYQLWLIKNGHRDNGGVFSVDAHGKARLIVTAAQPLTDLDAVGITIEPFGGSTGPTGKKVLGGQMNM